ncbi:survival motor neuron protein 1-like [Babylonia areolata]|uniref:survival motor neuron protein 1-like n=1 Tax=Babylonia areolata TaxID=304850 RepID=UPI003FD6A99D
MAGAEGTVLFHRAVGNEEEYDSDIWDDTALIEAYDAAVAPLKAKLAAHTGDPSVLEATKKTTDSGHSKKKKNKKKKSKQAKKKHQAGGWAVGDYCQAVFTEDGAIYEAKITSINAEDNTCVVRYLGYGNEEEQSLEDLIHPDRSAYKQRRSASVSVSETDSVSSASVKMGKKNRASSHPQHPSAYPSFGQGSSFHPPPPPPPPPHPFFPGISGHPPFGMPQPHMGSAASMPFSMMPPPPPPMPNDNVTNENEALCSMLLSWYMSGYHTGYYQGLKQGRQHDASAAMGPAR